jgi:aspartate kinase
MLLSAGEQISVALLAMAIEKRGYPVKSFLGWQAGFITDQNYSNARIRRIDKARVENELSKRTIVIVAGFQGINRYDDITTLGRGGSDTSAVALAAALGAERCQIFTDVDGVYTADPRVVKNALKLDAISYDEMLELASLGAQVLHNRAVEMAKRFNVNLEVLSSMEDKAGTIIKEEVSVEKMIIRGVAQDTNVARISITELKDKPGVAFRVFSLLAKKNINVDIILQSIGRHDTKDITFTVAKSNVEETMKTLESNKEQIGYSELICDTNIAKVSIVGAGMESNPGIASKMFGALGDAHVNIQMISTSEIKISVLIDAQDAQLAMNVIHDAFYRT